MIDGLSWTQVGVSLTLTIQTTRNLLWATYLIYVQRALIISSQDKVITK